MQLFITCPKGLESLLQDELTGLGASGSRQTVAGVACEASLETAYRICLWSRLGNRVLMPLAEGEVADADALYALVQRVDWLEHLRPSGTLTVDFNGRTDEINNTHFGALRVKDAIVDQIRAATGQRPSVERNQPDLRINVHLHRRRATVALDLSGESLHRRGYRLKAGAAPMKENLAAAVLIRAGWPDATLDSLLDPMCGSGTLLIEGALMAADIAPGLLRQTFGFSRWLGHDSRLWQQQLEEARQRRSAGLNGVSARFYGFDADADVLTRAAENARRAGVSELIRFAQRPLEKLQRPQGSEKGLLITNPPYGERLGDTPSLMFLYRTLGERLKQDFAHWRAAVFTGNPDLCRVMKLRAEKQYRLFNGTIDSRLLLFTVHEQQTEAGSAGHSERGETPAVLSDQAQMFANRLKKNLKQLSRWVKRESISCYRAYDADMPEYAVAVDIYPGHAVVQEYAPPASIDPVKALSRLQDVIVAVPQVLDIPAERVILKQRRRQQGQQQYERQRETGRFMTLTEHGCKLRVNLYDYLDTGLFLDHRPARLRVQRLAAGKDVLNLFCYTGSASVHAGVGGARSTTSVDLSQTYLDWARCNLELNGLPEDMHRLIRADCLQWLQQPHAERYDLIFMDPPTFSNSKRMSDVLDVQRDHVQLIKGAMALLRPEGLLIFSNNYRRFSLDRDALSDFEINDITPQTIDPDFRRNPKIHCCFEIRHRLPCTD